VQTRAELHSVHSIVPCCSAVALVLDLELELVLELLSCCMSIVHNTVDSLLSTGGSS
jgi:hypothetical protein